MKYFLPILVLISLIFASCNLDKDSHCDNSDLYTYLTPEQNARVPYKGDEIIKFKADAGDTIVFVCSGRELKFSGYNKPDPNCSGGIYLEDAIFKFKNFDSTYKFQVANNLGYGANSNFTATEVTFLINNRIDIQPLSEYLIDSLNFTDSIEINGKVKKARKIYFLDGSMAGMWAANFGLAQLFINNKFYTYYE